MKEMATKQYIVRVFR